MPTVLLWAGSRYQTAGRQLHCFFIPLDATQCFPAHQKYVGTTQGAARPISVLFWGTWLSGHWVCCYSSNTRKHVGICTWKNRWLISENSLILSLEEDNLPHICINIANVCTKLHCPVTGFGLCVWPHPPAAGEQEGGHAQLLFDSDFFFSSEEWERPAVWPWISQEVIWHFE